MLHHGSSSNTQNYNWSQARSEARVQRHASTGPSGPSTCSITYRPASLAPCPAAPSPTCTTSSCSRWPHSSRRGSGLLLLPPVPICPLSFQPQPYTSPASAQAASSGRSRGAVCCAAVLGAADEAKMQGDAWHAAGSPAGSTSLPGTHPPLTSDRHSVPHACGHVHCLEPTHCRHQGGARQRLAAAALPALPVAVPAPAQHVACGGDGHSVPCPAGHLQQREGALT